MKAVRMERWSLRNMDGKPGKLYLAGRVYGHPELPDGTSVVSTSLQEKPDMEGRRVVTKNTEYALGEIDPLWVRWLVENEPDSNALRFTGVEA